MISAQLLGKSSQKTQLGQLIQLAGRQVQLVRVGGALAQLVHLVKVARGLSQPQLGLSSSEDYKPASYY